MKKKVKIKFLGFWPDFLPEDNIFINILKEKYDAELSDNPDYLFFSPIADHFQYAHYDCVRILVTGEPFSADWNSTDYAIDFDSYTFGDRHMRYPLYLYQHQTRGSCPPGRRGLTSQQADEIIRQKTGFCNFIYGHQTVSGDREKIYELVSQYKRVDSIGKYLNNMPNHETAVFEGNGANKQSYLQRYKFTIAAESMSQPGFTTEKIKDAFDAYSIPIYWGNPDIAKEFNPDAFIDLNSFPTLEEGIRRLQEIDNDPQLYKKMLMAGEFTDPEYPDKKYRELVEFLYHIFDQDKASAYRRNRCYIGYIYNAMWQYMSLHFRYKVLKFFYLVYYHLRKENRR